MALINFSGLASGIDSESLISATSAAAKKQRVEPNQKRVTELTDTDTTLSDLKTKLATLQSNLLKFSSLEGGGVAKQGSSSDESRVSASATNAALNASYSVTVSALAKNGTVSLGPSAGTYASESATISAGTQEIITIGTGSSMETVTVPITAGSTTISQFVTSFNQLSTKARASLVNVGSTASPNYKIVITSNKTGTEEGDIAVTTNAAGFSAPTTSSATDASFSIAGIGSITRSSNSVSDVIAGVTLDLQSAGTSTVTISEDETTTEAAIQDWVKSWNEIVSYIKEKNQITRDEGSSEVTNVFSPLATTRVDDNALTSLRSALASARYVATNGSGTQTNEVAIMADLGITTERDGTLKFNTDTFKTALSNEPLSVSNILTDFADDVARSQQVIDQYIGFNRVFDTTINSNKETITNLNKRISEAEAVIAKQEESMRAQFARLEATIGKLQGQQNSLTSALAGLGG